MSSHCFPGQDRGQGLPRHEGSGSFGGTAAAVKCEVTLSPGTLLYQAAKHWECCAATPAAAPLGPRKTMGQLIWPALMYRVFAALLMMWSMACIAKLNVMNSQTGFRPAKAEPTAMPVKPACRVTAQMLVHDDEHVKQSKRAASRNWY